ncbi:cytochrome c oxidase subunit 5A, mitochondrial [Lingula anatina]|uniref:Cytochrome c oxidase subunit 5A, mitochondrial n=1 Tax=Lingula anatina TaxID=7574 RepID=A0A1S3H6B9_LINAN|nr:cytochrome c oxidase subunit 5A, mitochondrial [Lingula anatina]|eukprot:XP_013381026.1 cytochrome c oxidase subunit 5A, mitochondrial [Lingula anatina]
MALNIMFRAVLHRCRSLPIAAVQRKHYSILPANMQPGGLSREEEENATSKLFTDALNSPEIDGWDLRGIGNDFAGGELIPDADICIAYINACRRVNDYALGVRFLEFTRHRHSIIDKKMNSWKALVEEIKPALEEVGMDIPEELGYDKPELALKDVESNDYYA